MALISTKQKKEQALDTLEWFDKQRIEYYIVPCELQGYVNIIYYQKEPSHLNTKGKRNNKIYFIVIGFLFLILQYIIYHLIK